MEVQEAVTLSTLRQLKAGYTVTKRSLGPTCKVRSSFLSAWTSAEGLSVPVSSETRQHQKVLISEDAENVNKKTVKTCQTWMLKQILKHNTLKVPLKSTPPVTGPSTSKYISEKRHQIL